MVVATDSIDFRWLISDVAILLLDISWVCSTPVIFAGLVVPPPTLELSTALPAEDSLEILHVCLVTQLRVSFDRVAVAAEVIKIS